jgi:hypothetical protein
VPTHGVPGGFVTTPPVGGSEKELTMNREIYILKINQLAPLRFKTTSLKPARFQSSDPKPDTRIPNPQRTPLHPASFAPEPSQPGALRIRVM